MADTDNTQLTEVNELPAAETEQKETVVISETPAKSGGQFTFILLLIVIIATGSAGYYLWQQQQQLIKQQHTGISQLQQQLSQLDSKSGDLNQSLQTSNNRIQSLESQQHQINELAQQALDASNRTQRDWILAEVDYLLRLATRRLQIARDINGAIAALSAADQRIHDLGDLSLLPIRQQLAKDIAALKKIHQVDVNGAALSLDQMILLVADLPFKSAQEEIKSQLDQPETKEVTSTETKGFVDSVINTVKSIGDIKIHHRSIQPASSTEQQLQIEQILRTYLLSARLAVLRYDPLQFSHDIEQAQQLIHLHYNANDNRITQMQSDLLQLSNLNLLPDLPDISKSWLMLQDVIKGAKTPADKDTVIQPVTSSDKSATEVL